MARFIICCKISKRGRKTAIFAGFLRGGDYKFSYHYHVDRGGLCSPGKAVNMSGMSRVENESLYDTYYMYSDAPEGGESIRKWKDSILPTISQSEWTGPSKAAIIMLIIILSLF